MKLHGIKVAGAPKKTIVLPRDTGNLVFVIQAVLESNEFDKIYPAPIPPVKKTADGQKIHLIEDPDYRKSLQKWGEHKSNWMLIKALSSTPGLEWETIDLANPETWGNVESELVSSGLTDAERLRLMRAYIEVQGLDDEKVKAATDSFLAGLQEEKDKA
jgi:hypothetical protein